MLAFLALITGGCLLIARLKMGLAAALVVLGLVVAYAVGFGDSMVWFGLSAGVALTNMFPQGKSVWTWVRQGWHVPVAYVLGFAVMLAMVGWHPQAPHKPSDPTRATHQPHRSTHQ